MAVTGAMSTMALVDLPALQREFLEKFMAENPPPPEEKCFAVYLRTEKNFFFIDGAKVGIAKGGAFAKTAPKSLYRGGGEVIVKTRYGVLATADERPAALYFKPLPIGWASYPEGHDLSLAALREFEEEVRVYRPDKADPKTKTVLFVPKGIRVSKMSCPALNLTFDRMVEVGNLVPIGFVVNEHDNALEFQMLWDISELENPCVHYDENEWWRVGLPGVPVVALNENGKLAGYFSGQQGFIPITWERLHPAFLDYFANTKAKATKAA